MEDENQWMISVGLVTSSLLAVAANLFLLVIFFRRRGLRTVPNRFVINLLITNLLSSILLIPLVIVDQSSLSNASYNNSSVIIAESVIEITNDSTTVDWTVIQSTQSVITTVNTSGTTRPFVCYSAQVSTSFVCTLSILSILLIGINQYFGVLHSLRYHSYVNKCRSTVLIASSWLAALVFSVFNCLTDSDSTLWHFCRHEPNKSDGLRTLNTLYALTYFLTVILAPFAAICIIYVCIYTAAHRNSERMRSLDQCDEEQRGTIVIPKVRSAPNLSVNSQAVPPRTYSERHNFIASLKTKLSNASNREETRAAKISVLVIFLVLFCYLPYGISLVLNSGLIDVRTSRTFNYLTLILLVVSNVISPFLFAYRNRRVKREIGKVFGLVSPRPDLSAVNRRRSTNDVQRAFLADDIPEVIVTGEKRNILTNWTACKKCHFIAVPESCMGEARGSFSSASTQISNEDC